MWRVGALVGGWQGLVKVALRCVIERLGELQRRVVAGGVSRHLAVVTVCDRFGVRVNGVWVRHERPTNRMILTDGHGSC